MISSFFERSFRSVVRRTFRLPSVPGLCLVLVLASGLSGCRNPEKVGDGVLLSPRYDSENDAEIRAILGLANDGRWDEAVSKAEALYRTQSADPQVTRVYRWVTKESQILRDSRLEDDLRAIDERDSVFTPTIPELAREERFRGLPARRDVRDAVEDIETTPYVPETFGETVTRTGSLLGLDRLGGEMEQRLDREISIQMDELTLGEIIFTIGEEEGLNFVADKSLEAFKKKVSVNFPGGVTLREFFQYISRNLGIQFQVGDGLIWIVDAANETARYTETRFYRLRHGFLTPAQFGPEQVETETKTQKEVTTTTVVENFQNFVMDGTPQNPSIEVAMMKFFKGDYYIDYERNLIVAEGTREELSVLEELISEFDRPIDQVLIEARFVTVSEAAFMQLGAAWQTGAAASELSTFDFTGLGPENVVGGIQETFTNVLDREDFTATLTALQQSGESQTLSAPRITLLNNRPAKIQDGKVQYYYEEYTVTQTVTDRSVDSALVPAGKPSKITSGVELEVMASIGADGESILLALAPQVNQEVELVTFARVEDADGSFEIRLPETRTQSLATRMRVKSGQTVVLGGVLERQQSTFVESVPVLGDLPYIGAIFRRRTEIDKPRYLLIFVSATLLSETGEFIEYVRP